MNHAGHWSAAQIPDQSGRIVVITGANCGIGYETAAALAGKGAHTVLVVRNMAQGATAIDRIRAQHPSADLALQELDLASMSSIHAAARELRSKYPAVDLLINNAGLVSFTRQTTRDGFEQHFGICHLGHFAFTGLMMDRLLATPKSRVVTVSSLGHRMSGAAIAFDDLNWQSRPYKWMQAYGQAKLANLLFTYELQRRLASVGGVATIATAAHPGTSKTNLVRNGATWVNVQNKLLGFLHQSPEMGALPTLRAAADPAALGGQFFGPNRFGQQRGHPCVVRSSAASYDRQLQRRLWEVSQDLTDVRYPV
ncbi:oxidoreductase [Mycolicibacterium porcinum]|uniref:SDR family NAD(P)-dependent oxidoreductase n=1 Tax=Mycolicibacterium porcinum TaxID=39693 RepID=A0AAW5SVP0_9MYCO|nr:oxidoreductase [Mycolicibacterium porcinum]MCV7386453.1 SDR family NAD(P)-dependent oxidoreductase [Mycolicibacterium porcinum]ORB39048.1 short-chain dehydrogenase [Mycolicibacterium porcinum]CDO30876.1 short chain dehydrogenase [Mycolicibacterium vulneris]